MLGPLSHAGGRPSVTDVTLTIRRRKRWKSDVFRHLSPSTGSGISGAAGPDEARSEAQIPLRPTVAALICYIGTVPSEAHGK